MAQGVLDQRRVALALPARVRRSEGAEGVRAESAARAARKARTAPELERPVEELVGVERRLDLGRVQHRGPRDPSRDVPAREIARRIEPALVVPAGDVRREEELLPRVRAQPRPRLGVDAASGGPQQAGGVDDRRLDHPRALVEVRVLEDGLHAGAHRVAPFEVPPLERLLRPARRRGRDEIAPKLADEEGWVAAMVDAQPAGIAPVEAPTAAEDALRADVVPVAVEPEAVRTDALFPVVAEPRQRAGLLTNVALRVPAAGAEREELHQLTRVVLVRRPLGVVRPREREQHRRIAGDGQQQVVEPPQPVSAEERVLAEHQSLRADALVRRREPVVPDERHALDQWTAAAHHAVEPPEVVVAPGVPRREPAALVVPRRRPSEPLPPRRRQRLDGTVQALLREGLGLAAARTETGTPKQAFGLLWPEFAPIDG